MSAPVIFHIVTSTAAPNPKVVAEVDGVKAAWKVRTASRDGRYQFYTGWICAEHGKQECRHTLTIEAHLHHPILERMKSLERKQRNR